MTRGDLIRHCSLELALDATASAPEQLLMVDWANEGVRDVLIETRCRIEVGDEALTPGVADYRLDNDILRVDERTIEANNFDLQIITPEEMLRIRRSIGGSYLTYLAIEGDLLMVWPTPTSAVTITYLFVNRPTEMTNDAHDPSDPTYGGVPIYAHHAILQYMLWRGARYDERKSPHTPAEYRQFYQDELKRVRKRAQGMGGRHRASVSAGYPGRTSLGRRNDQYPAE